MTGKGMKRILSLMLALMMLLGVMPAVLAEGEDASASSGWAENTSRDLQQDNPQLAYRNGGARVESVDQATSLSLMFTADSSNPLPKDPDTEMRYKLPRDTACGDLKDFESDLVTCEYDASTNSLVFHWKNGVAMNDTFTVTIPVKKRDPFYTVNHVLREGDGNERVYLSEEKPFVSGALIREAPIEIEGYEGENAPYETEKRTEYDDVVTFYYHRLMLHYQVDYLAVDGTVLRPRSTMTAAWGTDLSPILQLNGYRFLYCDQGDLPIQLTEENQYLSLRYSDGTVGASDWMPPSDPDTTAQQGTVSSSYVVRHVIPGEYTYSGQDIVLKTSAGTAGNPVNEKYDTFDGKYFCDESRTEYTESAVTFYYKPVQLTVHINYYEGVMREDGPVRKDANSSPLLASQTLQLWYGQDYDLNPTAEKHFTANGVEYTYIGTDNPNRDLVYHGTEENREFNLYFTGASVTVTQPTYTVVWKNYDGIVLETDQGVKEGTSPSYNSITPMRPTDDGYVYEFIGWEPAPGPVTGNTEYTATFNAIARMYTVKFENEDGSEIKSELIAYGTIPEIEDPPEKAPTEEFTYTFSGWEPALKEVTGDASYRAVYTAAKRQYVVKFVDADGNELSADTYVYGTAAEDIKKPDAPKREQTDEYTFEFAGWEPEITDVAADVTYKAAYTQTKRSYKITWKDSRGKVIDSEQVEYGTVPAHEPPEMKGSAEYIWVFTGWEPEVAPVTGKATYTATFRKDKQKYTIRFENEDGTELSSAQYEWGTKTDSITVPEVPAKPETDEYTYTFAGWEPDIEKVKGDATYKAVYNETKRKYTVRFVNADGTEISSEEYKYGTRVRKIDVPAKPTRADDGQYSYVFKAWEPEIADVTGDATYTATYYATEKSYTVRFVTEDGVQLSSGKYAYGTKAEAIPVPEAPAKDEDAGYRYTFAGWDPAVTDVTDNVTYRATYSAETKDYTVRFVGEDGTEISAESYPYGTEADAIAKPETPVKENTAEYEYAFSGWEPEINAVTGDATYTATFGEIKRSYTIRFLGENGEELASGVYPYGTEAKKIKGPPVPVKDENDEYTYTFAGWDPQVTDVTGDATYTVVFDAQKKSYTVHFVDEDNKELGSASYAYGTKAAEIVLPEVPAKAGDEATVFVFAGWEPQIADVTGDATYTAVYSAEIRQYTVRFLKEDGSEVSSASYPYGTKASEIQVPAGPEKAATEDARYTFQGWSPAFADVTADQDYKPVYAETKLYTVRFLDEAGNELSAKVYDDGTAADAVEVPAGPEKAATEEARYTFRGWSPEIADVTGNIDYTPAYTETKLYTVRFLDGDGNELSAKVYDDGTAADAVEVPAGPEKAATEEARYTFRGWSPEIADVTGNADYTPAYVETKLYTVRFLDGDGKVLSTKVYDEGTPAASVEIPAGPEKAETAEFTFAFAGWEPEIADVTANADYTAVYTETKKSYQITWTDENGLPVMTEELAYGEIPKQGALPKRETESETYTFAGWDPEPVAVTGDATYRATYTAQAKQFTIRFLDAEGEELSAETYAYGTAAEEIVTPENPVKGETDSTRYTFMGWSPAIAPVTGDATYQAVVTAETKSYPVRFLAEDGTELSSAMYPYGTAAADIAVPEVPAKEDTVEYTYAFQGWKPQIADVTGSADYTASYTETKRSYTVRFLMDDGTEISSNLYRYGTFARKIEVPRAPKKAETDEYTYAFTGWTPEVTAVVGDADYTAVFSAKKRSYKVRFLDEAGGELGSDTYEYGTLPGDLAIPEAPVKAETAEYRYTFRGWEPEITEVKGSATYTAAYDAEKKNYTVRFLSEDGAELSSASYAYGTSAVDITVPEAPKKEATAEARYVFTGWTPQIADVTGDAAYTATYRADALYTVRFLDEHEEELSAKVYPAGTAASALEIPAVPDKAETDEFTYTFAGWEPELTDVTEDADYTVQYTETKRSYRITWAEEDGTPIMTESIPYGETPKQNAPPKPETESETYTFAGWDPEPVPVTGDATYRATYRAEKKQFTVQFTDAYGEELSAETYAYGTAAAEIRVPEAPAIPATDELAYTFAGWNPEIADVTGDATYAAAYTAEKRSYTVRFVSEDGTELSSASYEYGTAAADIQVPDAPAKEATPEYSYTFSGWKPQIADVTGDATYTATYRGTERSYTIRFLDEDGTELTSGTYVYGTHAKKIKGPAVPKKAATDEYTYTFAGWEPEVANVTADAEYKAVYSAKKNSYRITWLNDDGSLIVITDAEYGTLPERTAPEKEATAEYTYTFAGWEPALTQVTGDTSYKATYTAEKRSYKVTWLNEDGSEIDSVTAEYGTTPEHAPAEKAATAEYSYAFAGWDPAVAPVTGNATYTATFSKTKRSYEITWADETGDPIMSETLEYGATPKQGAPEKTETDDEVYVFTGWVPAVAPVTGDATYAASYRAIRKITVRADSASFEYDGRTHTLGSVQIVKGSLIEGDRLEVTAGGMVTNVADGTVENAIARKDCHIKRGDTDVTGEYQIALEPGTLSVTPRKVTITSGSSAKPYDGTPLTDKTVSIEGLADGEKIKVTPTGKITQKGTVANTFDIEWAEAKESNYEVTRREGALSITENESEITLTAATYSKEYDGTPLVAGGISVSGLPAGFTVRGTVSGTQTDVGSCANEVTGWTILDADGEDRTDCFTGVVTKPGTLTVTKRPLSLTTGTAKKEFDGTPLVSEDVKLEGLAEGESVTLTMTGSLKEIGSIENGCEITWDKAKEGNYELTTSFGTLTVEENTAKITLTTASAEKVYDGKPLTAETIEADGLPTGFTVEGEVTGKIVNAGSVENVLKGDYRIVDSEGEDRTACFSAVTVEHGTLTVKKRTLTITTGSAEKVYDGYPLWNAEVSAEGLAEGESVSLRTNGSRKEKGVSNNTYMIVWDHAKAANYEIVEKLGTLRIK